MSQKRMLWYKTLGFLGVITVPGKSIENLKFESPQFNYFWWEWEGPRIIFCESDRTSFFF